MGNIRDVDINIVTNSGISYSAEDIISVDIRRSITDGSFGIGYAQSDRLVLTVIADDKLQKKTRIVVNASIDGGESERLGRFYVHECTRDGSAVTVTAYDAMYLQDKKLVKFGGKSSINLAKLTFPCLMQDVLDYIVAYRNLSCDFECQPFTVQKKPMKPDGTYYTVREILGFIAASHGANAKFDNAGKLTFQPFSASETVITASDAVDFTIDDSEPFKVTGLLFSVDDETQIYIDDVPGSEFDEDNVGVVKCYNPFVTVDEEGNSDIANYAWSKIGKVAYYGGSITQRGMGHNNCGDVITVGNLKYPADTEEYQMCITDISYSITADGGFMETLSSQADKSENSASYSGSYTPKSYGQPTDPAEDTSKTVHIGDTWAKTDSSGVIQEVYQRDIDDSDNEVWKSIGTVGGTGGVGKNVGFNNEIFGSYEDKFNTFFANKITGGSLYSTDFNHSEGRGNTMTSCDVGHTEGLGNTMTNCREGCHEEGSGNTMTSCNSTHVQGENNTVSGVRCSLIAGGYNTVSGGQNLFVSGYGNDISSSSYGAVIGNKNIVKAPCQFSLIVGDTGKYYSEIGNSLICGNPTIGKRVLYSTIAGNGITINANVASSAIFGEGHKLENTVLDCIIGGAAAEAVENCLLILGYGGNKLVVNQSGDVTAAGSITPSGADYAEYFEWADGNPENEDRRGMLVTLDGDKLVPAHGEDFIGVVSSAPSVIGNGAPLNWSGKYKTDAFGSIIRDENGNALLSDSYDPECKYIPRSKRKEWSAVGLVGRLVIIDSGGCRVGGYVSARNGLGAASNTPTRARVLRRIDGTHVEVLVR